MIDIINGNGDNILYVAQKIAKRGKPVTYKGGKVVFRLEGTQLVETQNGQVRRWETEGIAYLPYSKYFNLPTL